MQKTICKKIYDTEKSTLVKKYCEGEFGNPAGYEESLYQTEGGFYFLYTNGGVDSKYTSENITRMSADKAKIWLSSH